MKYSKLIFTISILMFFSFQSKADPNHDLITCEGGPIFIEGNFCG